MKKISNPVEFQKEMERLRLQGKTIGFVPTMGALHEGHLSLFRRSREENDMTAASIFVNPMQFGPKEDFKKYPRPVKEDYRLLEKEKVNYLFCPRPQDMYPPGFSTSVEVSALTGGLCGKSRPGHFQGVTTVVAKLFQIAKPHRVYFGAKDYQQAAVIRRMIRDLNFDIDFCLCPTVREKDGLAMSSRNRYLSPEDRRRAVSISQTLFAFQEAVLAGEKNLKKLRQKALSSLRKTMDRIDYFEAVDADSLKPLEQVQFPMAVLTACFAGKTRLIDNVIIHPRA